MAEVRAGEDVARDQNRQAEDERSPGSQALCSQALFPGALPATPGAGTFLNAFKLRKDYT